MLSLDKFKELLKDPMIAIHPEIGHRFQLLQEAGHFSRMPHELLPLARELAHAVDWFCMDAGCDKVELWGPRMMHLIDLLKTNASPPDREELDALVARAHAFGRNFTEARRYISERAEAEGCRMVVCQEHFKSSHFHQVLTTTVTLLSLCIHESWEAAIVYFFDASYPRWKQINMGVDKFLVDGELFEVLGFFSLQGALRYMENWEPSGRKELLDFVLSAFNGAEKYPQTQRLVMDLHRMGQDCPTSLVVEKIHGLRSNIEEYSLNGIMAKEALRILPLDTTDFSTLERLIMESEETARRNIASLTYGCDDASQKPA